MECSRHIGWGLNQTNGVPSDVLKKIELPVVGREECIEKSTPEFESYITADKFCAGYLNGASVCQGDSGGGLVFARPNRREKVYMLRGIVSTGGNKGTLNAQSCHTAVQSVFDNFFGFNLAIFSTQLAVAIAINSPRSRTLPDLCTLWARTAANMNRHTENHKYAT